MTSKLSQNGTFWMRNHSNTSRHLRVVWNRAGNPKVILEENRREFRPCRSHFSVAKRPHSTQRARKVPWKNWREFRLCKRLFFVMHRLHSTQQMRKLSKNWRAFRPCSRLFSMAKSPSMQIAFEIDSRLIQEVRNWAMRPFCIFFLQFQKKFQIWDRVAG